MKYFEKKPQRLQYYNYSNAGYYFITFCSFERGLIFGRIEHEKMILNPIGIIVEKFLLLIPQIYSFIELDEFIIMPDHIHLILINNNSGSDESRSKMIISKVIQQYKRRCSVEIRKLKGNDFTVWQKSFYDRIIRNEMELKKIRDYIRLNPMKWHIEKNNLENLFM